MDIVLGTLDTRAESLHLAQLRFDAGVGSELELREAQTLQATAAKITDGRTDFQALESEAEQSLGDAGLRPDYFNIVNSQTLKPATAEDREITILTAAFLGTTRLIDNLSLTR